MNTKPVGWGTNRGSQILSKASIENQFRLLAAVQHVKNQWLALTKDSVGPVNSDGQLCAFHEFRTFSKSVRSYCRRLLLNGCQWIACLLQFSNNLPWNFQQFLMWILSQWAATSLLLLAYNQTQRRILSIFDFLHLPQNWTFEWWSQTNVVYMRLHWTGDFYIGSMEIHWWDLKFECSKFLRSSQADHDYIVLLCRLSRNLSEPFRSRARQQLKLILQFWNSDFPPANVPLRLLILDDEMESQMRSWLKGFIVHHQVSFPPFILLIRYAFIVLVNGMSCWFGHFWITKYLLL